MSFKYTKDHEFRDLAIKISQVIDQNGGLPEDSKDRLNQQKNHVEKLYRYEQQFKKQLNQYQQSVDVYRQFIEFIKTKTNDQGEVIGNGNILTAQPYFRESGKVFASKISKVIKKEDPRALLKFDINALMMQFVMDRWSGKPPKKMEEAYKKAMETRRLLVENNLPLAINRAKKFYRTTPKSHITLLDLINIATDGLLTGIDKYTGPYTPVWRSVCIGRMVGFMIEECSQTFIRMYPSDRKILYRANSLKHRLKIENTQELTKAVNESFEKDRKEGRAIPKLPITEHQILSLMNSSSYLSVDVRATKDSDEKEDGNINMYEYYRDNSETAEESLIRKDLINKISVAGHSLSLIQRKIIKLKGVDI
jgi:hypothetical protein